jgi:hypothetical protein
MASQIVAEISHDSGATWKTHASYETFSAFSADMQKFKDGPAGTMLKVHIPGSFALTGAQHAAITALGITLF